MHLPISLQLPDTSALDTLHKEWPTIKAAPYSFAISIVIVGMIVATVVWLIFRQRLDRYKEQVEHLERDIQRMQRERDSMKSAPIGGSTPSRDFPSETGKATATIGDIHFHAVQESTHPPAPTPARDTLKPRLICTKLQNLPLIPNVGGIWGEHDVPRALRAGVAVITNRAGAGGVGYASLVKAQMIFYDELGNECFHGIGAWLNCFSNKVDFPPGSSNKLLIALDIDKPSVGIISNTREHSLPHQTRLRIKTLEAASHISPEKLPLPLVCEISLLSVKGEILGSFAVAINRGFDDELELMEVAPL